MLGEFLDVKALLMRKPYCENMKANDSISRLMQYFELIIPELGKLIRSLRKMVLSIAPSSGEKVMYGGIIFTIPDRMFCGLFLRKNHISIEFDLGYLLKDPENHLEGSGKYRRHLKIFNKKDIEIKKVKGFISQSFKIKPIKPM